MNGGAMHPIELRHGSRVALSLLDQAPFIWGGSNQLRRHSGLGCKHALSVSVNTCGRNTKEKTNDAAEVPINRLKPEIYSTKMPSEACRGGLRARHVRFGRLTAWTYDVSHDSKNAFVRCPTFAEGARMSDEFVLTYPCFVPTSKDGKQLLTVYVDDVPAIVFITDEDLLARFFRSRSEGNDKSVVSAIQFGDHNRLLDGMRSIEAQAIADGIEHVAIDPGGRFKCAYTTIREFVEYVEGLFE